MADAAHSAHSALLLQFARAPVAGAVKTRMIPHLSPEQACDLHCELVLWTCRRLLDSGLGAVELAVAGDPHHPLFEQCLAMGAGQLSTQDGADLGQRMCRAIQRGLARYARVILVGSDCPGIDGDYIGRALQALEQAPLVLGPALDGGYVLIGARENHPEIFEGIGWGSATVYAQTAQIMRRRGLAWVELPALADVDRPGDLAGWQRLKSGAGH